MSPTNQTDSTTENTTDRRRRSYAAGATMARERMRREAPEQAAALDAVNESDIVVVRGCYDHVESVLDALGLAHHTIDPSELGSRRLNLRPEQLLVVNCPGNVDANAIRAVRKFVAAGGSLFTTDWALQNVVELAFPGLLAYNERPTADDVVGVEIVSRDNPFLAGVLEGADDPQWWLEGSSYPIKILDRDRVEVLLTSRELGKKYGEAPVAVLFHHGKGEVFHMISHYYLQRTELRTARHATSAAAYAAEKGVTLPAPMVAAMADLSLAEVEAAQTSARLFANVVAEKKRRGVRPARP